MGEQARAAAALDGQAGSRYGLRYVTAVGDLAAADGRQDAMR